MINIKIKSFAKDISSFSKEDEAAMQLKEKFQCEFYSCPDIKGSIYIMTSIRIFGQKRNDIDMLVVGFIENLTIKNVATKNYGIVKELDVKSFICNIELKSHSANGVKREGTDYIVFYSGVPHNASRQCREAKYSLYNHLYDQLSIKPFICDVLWFNGLSSSDLSYMRGSTIDNALPSSFMFGDLVNAILQQVNAVKIGDKYCLDSFNGSEKEYESIVGLFSAERKPQGLTRQKFELLSKKNLDLEGILSAIGNRLTIITGRAGTGKTIQLLQLAFFLANENCAKRCMILTYNNALVSDIKRLIDYTPMPSKVDGRTVSIRTIHSFFQTLMKEVGFNVTYLNPQTVTYDNDYIEALKQLYEFVKEKCQKESADSLKDVVGNSIDWDYILIDEAQDFSDLEKKILFKVYGASRLIVADGIDQFIRIGSRQIWERGIDGSFVSKPKTLELERRQKANLVTFVNAFARLANLDWRVRPNDELPGGEIKICSKFMKSTYDKLKANCEKNNCENYDILILQPPTQVTIDEKGNRFFSKANVYTNKAGIPIFDGINNRNRTTYPTKDQCRVYQYDSCRGLEGWCVVCANFDELIQYKLDTYNVLEDSLYFDPEMAKKRSVLLWALMPLTRPIDTLVITLSNADSEIGKMLKRLAEIYPDFIEWNIK